MAEESIENITKSDSNLVPTFLDDHLLLDITFNWHCSINNICIPKKSNKSTIFLHTNSMIKKFE